MNTINRVAFNTIISYSQLLLNVLLGLLTVRVVLNALGSVDYGIYDVVGGIVALLGFISSSLSQTSLRFMSVSLGTNNVENTKIIFKSCFWIHFLIAVGLAILLEITGIFLFNGFLNIPSDRIFASQVIYHSMVLTLFLNVIITPFQALIGSHEHFWYISLVGIFDASCKFLIALSLLQTNYDKLILYGLLMASINVLDFLSYILFCIFKYRSCLSFGRVNWNDMRNVTGFAGWTLIDVLSVTLTRQGYSVIINRFFGPSANASYGLSRQVVGPIETVGASIINAMKPQIMKSKGIGNEDRMFRLSLTAGKFGFSMMTYLTIPIIIATPDILSLWLTEVPIGTILFIRVSFIISMIDQLTKGLVYANQANGNIKWFSIIVSAIRVIALPFSWILFIWGYPVHYAIFVLLIFETIGFASRVVILSKISNFKISSFTNLVLLKVLPPYCISLLICYLSFGFFTAIWGIIFITILNTIIFSIMMYYIGFTSEEKKSINQIYKTFLLKLKLSKNSI